MVTKSCRDCANYEERRDIDGTSLCAKNVGPYMCCEEFVPRDGTLSLNRFYSRFCIECENFEDVAGVALCAKNHTPGISCNSFRNIMDELNGTQQNNRMKTVLIAHVLKENSDLKEMPAYLMETRRKIEW
jgi:hypothetical protein